MRITIRYATLILPVIALIGCRTGVPSSPVTPNLAAAKASAQPAAVPVKFTDVTQKAGIRFHATSSRTANKYMIETMGSGGGFIDFDKDGRLDILLLNGAPLPGGKVTGRPTLTLYRNNGDGTFTDVTHKAGLDVTLYAMGCAVGDYNNDGYDDIYITCALGLSRLYRNNGDGTFTDVTQTARVGNAGRWGTSCAWVDADNDGYLDLFVCNYVVYRTLKDDLPCYEGGQRAYCIPTAYTSSHCVLYHNNGNGTFTDISKRAGIEAAAGKGLGVAVWDYDGDGLPDIYVANDGTPGFLFHNLGHNRFEEVGTVSGLANDEQGNPHSGMGIDVGDLYNNGKSSVVITNYSRVQISFYDEVGRGLYHDDRLTNGVGPPSMTTLGFGACFVDVDNDGFPDLFVVNGHIQDTISETDPGVQYAEVPFLFHNEQNGHFREIGSASGPPFTTPLVARGAAWGDIDNDGKPDLLLTCNNGPAHLWHNDTPTGNHWLGVKLIGVKSNRDGIGARITVRAGGRTQTAMVRSGSSYLSASDLRAHFGLAGATQAAIEAKWPSGTVDRIENAAAGRYWTLREGSGRLE